MKAFIVLCVTANNAMVTLALSCAGGLPTWSLLEQAIVCLNLRADRILQFQAAE